MTPTVSLEKKKNFEFQKGTLQVGLQQSVAVSWVLSVEVGVSAPKREKEIGTRTEPVSQARVL